MISLNFLPLLTVSLWCFIFVLVQLQFGISIDANSNNLEPKTVKVALTASWKQTPLLFEASEHISKLNIAFYFPFIESIFQFLNSSVKLNSPLSDAEQIQILSNTVKSFVGQSSIETLQFALANRVHTAKVQSYQQILNETLTRTKQQNLINQHSYFIQFDDETIVHELIDLESHFTSTHQRTQIQPFKWDHIHPLNTSNSTETPTIIFYGDLLSREAADAYFQIVGLCKKTSTRLIYRPFFSPKTFQSFGQPLQLSGWAVELAVKNMEYKVLDDSNIQLREEEQIAASTMDEQHIETEVQNFLLTQSSQNNSSDFSTSFSIDGKGSVRDLKDLSYHACQAIVTAAQTFDGTNKTTDPFDVLREISLNFPMYTNALTQIQTNGTIRQALAENHRHDLVSPGTNLVQINGVTLDTDELSLFDIHDVLLSESRVLDEMDRTTLPSNIRVKLVKLSSLSTTSESQPHSMMMMMWGGNAVQADMFATNMQLTKAKDQKIITFLNNIPTDSRYYQWPSSVREYLAPAWPNSLRYVRKNMYTGIVYADFSTIEGLKMFEQAHFFVNANAPIRMGVLHWIELAKPKLTIDMIDDQPITRELLIATATSTVTGRLAALYHYLLTRVNREAASNFLLKLYALREEKLSTDQIKKVFRKVNTNSSGKIKTILKSNETLTYINNTIKYINQLNLQRPHPLPHYIVQGRSYVGKHSLVTFREIMMSGIMFEQQRTIMAVLKGELTDETDIDEFWSNKSNVYSRRSETIIRQKHDINFVQSLLDLNRVASIAYIQKDSNELARLTLWLVCDFHSLNSLKLIKAALNFVMNSSAKPRVSFVLSNEGKGVLNHLVYEILNSETDGDAALPVLVDLLEHLRPSQLDDVDALHSMLMRWTNSTEYFQYRKVIESISSKTGLNEAFPSDIQQLPLHSVIANGRLINFKVYENTTVYSLESDFHLIKEFSDRHFKLQQFADVVIKHRDSVEFDTKNTSTRRLSDILLLSALTLNKRSCVSDDNKNQIWPDYNSNNNLAMLKHGDIISQLHINAVINPLSESAQRIIPVLLAIRQSFTCSIHIYLNPKPNLSELPLKRFFRYSVAWSKGFFSSQYLRHNVVNFRRLITTNVLTMNIHTEESWSVGLSSAAYDCDNLNLNAIDSQSMTVIYQLQSLLINAQIFDSVNSEIPSGLQLYLSSATKPYLTDTVVMQNLGYAQLATQVGQFKLNLNRQHAKLYELQDMNDEWGNSANVLVRDLNQGYIRITVRKKTGMERMKLADLPADETDSPSLFSLSSLFSGSKSSGKLDTIHIFSLASGHLYERFLKLMILSVIKHTSHPVKFWFIRNFASPQFINFVPEMARHYGFEAEFVTYKWPIWLRRQTEKQRIIWGYKILFLDVLFPLSVQRIIYIDADQIVRGDVSELYHLDLNGRVYGYTPFCDSNKETEGFRFWKQGYWVEHLRGLSYHISALYVVDLKLFRLTRAGDTLRAIYDNLSADPNSLANLDQDLPNYAQHVVPIYSLPIEWLWCQTWCSMETLEKAKTIDLCNNPLTKKPKLEVAKSLIPEWINLDNEAREFGEQIEMNKTSNVKIQTETSIELQSSVTSKIEEAWHQKHSHSEL